jgi:hypothetical protein
METRHALKHSSSWFLLISLGILLLSGLALRADVTLTDRQAAEKEARKKIHRFERPRTDGTKARVPQARIAATGDAALIDNSGLEWFINTNITFSTSSSGSGAASEASYTHAVAATTLAGGTVASSLNDMFDGYNEMAISFDGSTGPISTGDSSYNIYNKNGAATRECSERQVVLNAQVIDHIQVQRKIYIPADDSFCRWLNIFTNQDTVSRTFNMVTGNNLGSDSNTIIVTTSDGDTIAEVSDAWVTTMQNYSGSTSSDPRIGHLLRGPGAPVGLAAINFANGDDNPFWAYTLTLAPGETAIIVNFAVGQPSKAAAAAKCAELITLPATALACMTQAELSQVRNFNTITNYTVRFQAGSNGSLSGRLKQTIEEGDNTSPVTAVANEGYIFSNWTGTGGFVSTANPLVVRNVNRDMTITANFANLPPMVEIVTPANGATVSGIVNVQVKASDHDGIDRVELTADGQQIGAGRSMAARSAGKSGKTQTLFPFVWDTITLANGQHALKATATDKAGLSASVTHKVNVDNVILTLGVSRLQERSWTMVREYAHLAIGLSHALTATAKYAVLRKEGSGAFAAIKEITVAELAPGSFTWNDAYLKNGSHYTYKVVALNSSGAVVGASPEISI